MHHEEKVVIAGASGFIGRWFIDRFRNDYDLIALSRKEVIDPDPSVTWRKVDLYSLTSTSEALKGADFALYLVHSMSPSTRLNQGSFEDTDLLLADNFARACESAGIRQIVFVGGILPKEEGGLSRHLRSRYEVEQTLGSRSAALTSLRAGIIIGPGGSSFQIVEKLTRRLPILACPRWTMSPCQPIDVRDMLGIIRQTLGNERTYGEAFEVGHPDVTNYRALLETTAKSLGKKRLIFSMPFFTLGLSKLWVGLFSDSSTTFVSPLIESLRHDMRIEPNSALAFDQPYHGMEESVRYALTSKVPALPRRKQEMSEKNTVRSVQRLPNPAGKGAAWVANAYPSWLGRTFRFLLTVKTDGDRVNFQLMGATLLGLQFIEDRSDADRQLFYIVGGLLVKRKDYGWLEFRSVLGNTAIITAIHEFVPRLPWFVYKSTQAIVHLSVMRRFGAWLRSQKPDSLR